MDYWDLVRPTYIENWPLDLCSLSIAQVDVPITVEEAEAIGTNMLELFEMFPKPHMRDIQAIEDRLDLAVNKFPNGAFVRLGSRSPKDSWIGHQEDFRCTGGAKAMRLILGVSERMMEDLLLAIKQKYPPHIFIREWIEIPKWAEFRCFMKGRELVGISQYQYMDGYFEEIRKYQSGLDFAIHSFFAQFRKAIHLDDVIFDVFVKLRSRKTAQGVENHYQVKLLEINPFFEMTDPCLFDWRNGGKFDGSFRFVKETE